MILSWISSRELRIQKTERVRHLDNAHASRSLLVDDLIAEYLHPRPMHLWAEVMFCVVAVVEPGPVIELVVAAHAPGDAARLDCRRSAGNNRSDRRGSDRNTKTAIRKQM